MGGAIVLPKPGDPGYVVYVDHYGQKWTACTCLAQWLAVYEKLLIAKKKIKVCIDVWQLTGAAAASAGTHSKGGVYDLLYQTDDECVILAREMGATASWRRTVSQGFSKEHQHGVLNGCPHNAPAAYQLVAQKAGYNGLGTNGRGGPDPLKGYPKTYRTWQQGIAWANAQIAALTPTPPAQLQPVKTTLATDHPAGIVIGDLQVFVATISPAVKGRIVFDYIDRSGEWVRWRTVPVDAGVGRATAPSTPSYTTSYRAGFDADDNTKYRDGNYSPAISVVAESLVDMRSKINALAQEVAALKAGGTTT